MQSRVEQNKSSHLLYLWAFALAYFSLNALIQFGVSKTADLDQAEQLILSQTFQFGYSAQPPLYTYLASVLFSLTGPGLAPLLGLKVLLLSTLIGLLMALGVQFNFTTRQHLVAVAGVVFLPNLIWAAQKDLTHSVLATTVAAATLLQVVRTQRSPMTVNYVFLGLLVGLGLISKYNFVLFLSALILAVLSVPRYRLLLTNWRILVSLFVLCIVSVPHAVWALGHYDIAASSAHKLHAGTGSHFAGFADAAYSAVSFLTPLWFFSIILISTTSKGRSLEVARTEDGKLLINLLVATMFVVLMFVMLTGAQQIRVRWYQPLLFHVPLLVALIAMPSKARPGYWYLGLGAVFAILISIALPARTMLAEKFNESSRPNMPYPAIIKSISEAAGEPAFILAETNLLGGNARAVFRKAKIRVPTYAIESDSITGHGIVLCETRNCESERGRDWLKRVYAIDTGALVFDKIERPYFYAPSKNMTVYWARVTITTDRP